MKHLPLVLLFVLGLQSIAGALDLGPRPGPRPKPPIEAPNPNNAILEKKSDSNEKEIVDKKDPTKLIIRIDKDATDAKLVIPKSVLRRLQVNLEKTGSVSPVDNNLIQPIGSRMGTVIGGTLMALSFLFGGIWLIRNRKMSAANLAAIVFVLSLSGIGTVSIVYANVGPPPDARSITGKIFSSAVHAYKQASGDVRIETTDDGDIIRFIVPDAK